MNGRCSITWADSSKEGILVAGGGYEDFTFWDMQTVVFPGEQVGDHSYEKLKEHVGNFVEWPSLQHIPMPDIKPIPPEERV